MARSKKSMPIEGVGRNPEDLLVQKSRPLFALWSSDLTLQEFKILDTYLARINSHDPEKRVVVFERDELEQLLGVTKINLPQLRERLKHLMGNVVEVGNPKQPKSIHMVTLFEEALAVQDDKTGLWEIHLECTQKAMKYFFNVENLGYLRYRLRGIVSLQSRYSYILFLYLESNRKFKTWTVDLEELKTILNCSSEETYKEFKRFNDLILKRCTKEIFQKTDQRYTYEPVKKGRKVIAIKFTLETLADTLMAPEFKQIAIENFPMEGSESRTIYADALPAEFTPEEVEVLRLLALERVPYDPSGTLPMECKVANYLSLKVAMMKAAGKKRPISNPYVYLKTMIERDEPV